jgi:hypothetical protein
MERPRNLIVLLQSGTATQDLWQPELANGRLHVANLSLGGGWSLDPLRRLSADTTYHVRVGEGLRGALRRLDVEGGRNWLSYPRVERRGSAGHDQVAIALIARSWTAIAVPGPWADEGRVVIEGRRHFCCGGRYGVSKLKELEGRAECRNIPDIGEEQLWKMKTAIERTEQETRGGKERRNLQVRGCQGAVELEKQPS